LSSRRAAAEAARQRAAAAAILEAGLRAADPRLAIRRSLRRSSDGLVIAGERLAPKGRLVLLAVGKAAAAMAAEAESILGSRLHAGLVVTSAATEPAPARPAKSPRFDILTAGHPVPDARGLRAAASAERLLRDLGEHDLLLLLLSGGASALLPAPAQGLRLEDKARATSLLMRAGANIHELNTVRKHLSRLKGGGLARQAAPARVRALVLSDVVGDDLSTIASGPAAPDPTTFTDALRVLRLRGLLERVPKAVRAHLEAGEQGRLADTPKPGDPIFRRVRAHVVGGNRRSLEAAAGEARRHGYRTLVLTSRLEGEAREAARALVSILRECVESGRPVAPPVCLLAGGETTVTVRGQGHGGRNQEMAVAAALPLDAFPVEALFASLATDGIDGRSDAAGGTANRGTVRRAESLGLARPEVFLAESDSRAFLGPLGDLIVTGPTGTNVMDVTLLLADRRAGKVEGSIRSAGEPRSGTV
jgi:hydroxypyruvate reductase